MKNVGDFHLNELDRLLDLGDDLLNNDCHGKLGNKQIEEYGRLKKKIMNELDKIEEYKACKQYWYDKWKKLKERK